MLQQLHIQNYAIIDEISIDFSESLNIITGETGAGKSILMGALSLILGGRAESTVLVDKEKKCVVEAKFTIKNKKAIESFCNLHDLDAGEDVLVRREIAVTGKSRAFINDTPVNLQQLKELGSMLVDLHQQFDTLELGDNSFQREVLDALAGNIELVQQYSSIFNQYHQSKKELEALRLQQQNANSVLDYNQFLFDELAEADLKENELEELDTELKLLSNAENVKLQLGNISAELQQSEQPLVLQLKSLVHKLHSLEEFHIAIEGLAKRMQSAQLELQDIADELETINEAVQYSPERIQLVNDKISLGYKLLKKHSVNSTKELLKIKSSLQEKLGDILNIGEAILHKEKETENLLQQCQKQASVIAANRTKAAKPFTENANALLMQVGMPNAKIKVQLSPAALNQFGAETIEFLFDANKSNRFEPLRKVASGGELSRLMLCIKSLVAQRLKLPTLIFDEIDTGISGEAAKQVGMIMKSLSQSHQLIAITHQPQIAAKASAHYFVYKAIKANKISTSIRLLSNDERVTTIAQMLSGEKPTAAALENAREMVAN